MGEGDRSHAIITLWATSPSAPRHRVHGRLTRAGTRVTCSPICRMSYYVDHDLRLPCSVTHPCGNLDANSERGEDLHLAWEAPLLTVN